MFYIKNERLSILQSWPIGHVTMYYNVANEELSLKVNDCWGGIL